MKQNKQDQKILFLHHLLLHNSNSGKNIPLNRFLTTDIKQQTHHKLFNHKNQQLEYSTQTKKFPSKITNIVLDLNLKNTQKYKEQDFKINKQIPQKTFNHTSHQIKMFYTNTNIKNQSKFQQNKKKKKSSIVQMIRNRVKDFTNTQNLIAQAEKMPFKTLQGYALMRLPIIDMQRSAGFQKSSQQQQLNQYSILNYNFIRLSQSGNGHKTRYFKNSGKNIQTQVQSGLSDKNKIIQQNNRQNIRKGDQFLVIQSRKLETVQKIHQNHSSLGHYDYQPPKFQNRKQKKALIVLPKQKQYTVYEHKIKTYRDFIFQVNFGHNYYDPVLIKQQGGIHRNQQKKYKVFIGKGNNSLLIKSLFKRRFWWIVTQQQPFQSHFLWTQLKLNQFFKLQISKKQLNNEIDLINRTILKLQNKIIPKLKNKEYNLIKSKKRLKPVVPKGIEKIFHKNDIQIYRKFEKFNLNQDKMNDFDARRRLIQKKLTNVEEKFSYKVHNHLQCNYFIGNKKALFYNMKQYYDLLKKNVFDYLPFTFHIKNGIQDKQYKQFIKYYRKKQFQSKKLQQKSTKLHKNIWIIKPGQNSNRGNGITVIDKISQLNAILKKKQFHPNGTPMTYIVQSYIDRPLLYNKRKFDIRHYMLITTLYGKMKGYWYSQGYIRTSSYKFNVDDLGNQMIHLTNDAIQKNSQIYGKYEQGNKISYIQFQKYLDSTYDYKYNFYQDIYPKMKQIAKDSIRSCYNKLDPNKKEHNFQIFGLDFMIDQNFQVWLIQINTNPCLQISSALLGRIIPTMVQHSFRLSLDILFPPSSHYPNTIKPYAPDNILDTLKYQIIFDEIHEEQQLNKLYSQTTELDYGLVQDEEQIYEDDGEQIQIQRL